MAENIEPEDKKAILRAVEYHFPHAKVILFGSRARGTNRPGADVDIALDIGAPIWLAEMNRIRTTMENLATPLSVDVVDMHNIPERLKEIILREGVVWKN